jgi:hypothetical protein
MNVESRFMITPPSLNTTERCSFRYCRRRKKELYSTGTHYYPGDQMYSSVSSQRRRGVSLRLISIVSLTAILPLFGVVEGRAQEADCTVQVNYEGVSATYKDLLVDFGNEITMYVNNHNWGGGDAKEKVKCALNIFIQNVSGENKYQAQVFVGSQRPIYKSNQSTATVRIFDGDWEFTYIKGRPIVHSPYTFNDLTSVIDFYMNLVMAFDYDTYDKLGGTAIFQRVADIASLGRSSGQKGWQLSTSGYNRAQLIDELMKPQFNDVRTASYIYHFEGLDSLGISRERGMGNVQRALLMIAGVRKSADPRNLLIRTFFETKYMEIATLLQNSPDSEFYDLVTRIDPAHMKTYDEYHAKSH